jgi:hypothetical protein
MKKFDQAPKYLEIVILPGYRVQSFPGAQRNTFRYWWKAVCYHCEKASEGRDEAIALVMVNGEL